MARRVMPVGPEFYKTSGFGPRWGTHHRGVDFGRDGGSGGQPVYAAQGGTVVYAGAASGFGGPDPAGWVVIDHPTADGAGTTVYGHVIREVAVGQRVEAGQRIARINPDSGSNGGVAPHLHFEVHPTVWAQGSQIDPEPWLAWANQDDREAGDLFFGVDISNHQNGFSLERAMGEGFDFAFIKATEGTWKDPVFDSHRREAEAIGLLYAAYVYVRGETSAEEHARALDEVVGDPTVPVALDIEANSGTNPAHWRNIAQALERKGYRVALSYIPGWYWRDIGRPSLSGLPPLWTSNYPSTQAGFASALYDRAGAGGWEGYGGLDVAVWQFTDRANVAGWSVDANAFRGSKDDLRALFARGGRGTINNDEGEISVSAENRIIDFIKGFVGPIGSDVKDLRQQVTGSRDLIRREDGSIDLEKSYPGWAQLGKDSKGRNLTLVDALAAARNDIAECQRRIASLEALLEKGNNGNGKGNGRG